MQEGEVSLKKHLDGLRANSLFSTVILCCKVINDQDSAKALQTHMNVVENEVNTHHTNITGILIGQVYIPS